MDTVIWTLGKVVLKVGMNTLVPMSGSAIEFMEAANCVANGDYIGATINTASGLIVIGTFGMWGAAKDVAQSGGKEVAVQATKQSAKEMTKNIGQAASVKIAREGLTGAAKRQVIGSAMITSKEATKMIGANFAVDLGKGMIEDATEQALKDVTQTTLKSITIESIRGGVKTGGKDFMQGVFSSGLEESLTGATTMFAKASTKAFASTGAFDATKEFASGIFMNTATDVAFLKDVSSPVLGALWHI